MGDKYTGSISGNASGSLTGTLGGAGQFDFGVVDGSFYYGLQLGATAQTSISSSINKNTCSGEGTSVPVSISLTFQAQVNGGAMATINAGWSTWQSGIEVYANASVPVTAQLECDIEAGSCQFTGGNTGTGTVTGTWGINACILGSCYQPSWNLF